MSDPSGPTRPWGAMKDWVDTVSSRLPDIRTELERFNEERARLLAYQPIDTDSRMPLPRSGVGGDVAE